MPGMNPEPCASYSLADRFVCEQCGESPEIESVTGDSTLTVKLSCHGAKQTLTVEKRELVFTQACFQEKD